MSSHTARLVTAILVSSLAVTFLSTAGCNKKTAAGGSAAIQLFTAPDWAGLGISTLAYVGARNNSGEATALENAGRLIAAEVRNQNRYIVLGDQVAEERAAAAGKSDLLEHVRKVWRSDQVVDQFAAADLCTALGVDALLVADLSDWTEYEIDPTQEGTSWSRVGIGLYIYSPKGSPGPLVWGANRVLREDSLPYRPTGGSAVLADEGAANSSREREGRRDNALTTVPPPPPIEDVARAVLTEVLDALPPK